MVEAEVWSSPTNRAIHPHACVPQAHMCHTILKNYKDSSVGAIHPRPRGADGDFSPRTPIKLNVNAGRQQKRDKNI